MPRGPMIDRRPRRNLPHKVNRVVSGIAEAAMLEAVAKILIGALLGVLFLIAMALAYAHDLLSDESGTRPPFPHTRE